MSKFWMTAVAVFAGPVLAIAQVAPPPAFNVPTARGQGLVTGGAGRAEGVMIPGSPVPGTVMNNGNGTSSIMVPGAPSQLVPTPR